MPLEMYFEYKEKQIKLPYLPESFEVNTATQSESSNVVGLGEVNIIGAKKLQPFTISSFFYRDEDPQPYIDFFDKIQEDRKPVRFIFEPMKINKLVSVDGFQLTMEAGRENDRIYTLELLEWRDYSPQLVETVKKAETEEGNQIQEVTPPSNVQSNAQGGTDIGDIVQFKGGNHYHTSQDIKPTGKPRTAGNAKITLVAKGSRHPFHLIGVEGGSDVYGWVDEGSF